MLNNEADTVSVAALARLKAESKARERAAEEVLDEIRARMEAERLEIERA